MNSIEYWEECISEAACELELNITDEQLNGLAKSVDAGHESYGQAFYAPPISEHPVFAQVKELERQLNEEKEKVVCSICGGTGKETGLVGTSHRYISTCWKCNGDGRHKP